MLDPSIDRPNEPFCYFAKPTDMIGVMDGREGTLVSPEGYFYTGWGSAKFRIMLRNMMVREQEATLHFLSALSPEWIHDGAVVALKRAPTTVGEVNFELRCRAAGATLVLEHKFSGGPQKMVLHIPWFMTVSKVTVDGKQATVTQGTVDVPVNTRTVELQWSRAKDAPTMSYRKAVEDYKAEYRKRYEASIH
jgi:hypothetical protein